MADRPEAGARPLRCFVAGVDDRDTRLVVDRARELKMEARTENDIKPASESPREAIQREIRNADIVIAVLPAKDSAPFTFFEVGVAAAFRVPVLLITSLPAQTVPLGLSDLPRLPLEIVRTDEFDATLRSIWRHRRVSRKPPQRKRKAARRLPKSKAAELSRPARGVVTEVMLIDLLAEAFASAGGEVARESKLADMPHRADLLVWSDDLNSLGANPLVVDVKRDLNPSAIYEVASQVEKYLTAANTQVALVVYLEGPDRYPSVESLDRRVVFVEWSRLLERMSQDAFPQVVASLTSAAGIKSLG